MKHKNNSMLYKSNKQFDLEVKTLQNLMSYSNDLLQTYIRSVKFINTNCCIISRNCNDLLTLSRAIISDEVTQLYHNINYFLQDFESYGILFKTAINFRIKMIYATEEGYVKL